MQPQAPIPRAARHSSLNAHERWQALVQRDPAHHSSFIYGVKSTKIYCRPTCTARVARRANVVYYNSVDEAQRAGFRPCKRCKPNDSSFTTDAEAVVTKVLGLLSVGARCQVGVSWGLKSLAKEAGVTPSYLARVFKKSMGVTVGVYLKEFEKEVTDASTELLMQRSVEENPAIVRAGIWDTATGLLTPADSCPSPDVASPYNQVSSVREEDQFGFDPDFDLDEWIRTEDFLDTSSADQLARNMEEERLAIGLHPYCHPSPSSKSLQVDSSPYG